MKWSVMRWSVLGLGLAALLAAPAEAREWKIYESEKYGFSLKVPAEFELHSEDKGASWMYQAGSVESSSGKSKSKSRSFGVNVRGFGFRTSESESSSESGDGGGGLEPAVSIHVNWVWMPDVDSGTLYSTNKKSDQQNIDSPDPDYKDIIDFDEDQGYAHEGNTYWYKEVDKSDGDEIHRWHIKSYGNKSHYGVILAGTYEQFKEWGPVYEEVIKSWKLIPMKE